MIILTNIFEVEKKVWESVKHNNIKQNLQLFFYNDAIFKR